MKTLYLFRHAKSSWAEPGQTDSDRSLAPRGKRAAAAMGRYLRRAKIVPGVIMCSTAVRARETLSESQETWIPSVPVQFRKDLYMADGDVLLATVHALDERHDSAMLVGHEPGFGHFAIAMTNPDQPTAQAEDARRRIAKKFSTGAVAALSFPVDAWREVAPGTGHVDFFVRPRDLDE